MGCILGLDFGTKRVGAAVSDPRHKIATPLEIYERRDPVQDGRHYQALVKEHEIERIVIGLPVHLGGREGASASLARTWGDWLRALTGLAVVYYDERYTTADAEDVLISVGMKRSKRKGFRDMLAARLLLQNYLDDGCPDSIPKPAPLSDPDEAVPIVTTLIVGCGYLGRRVGRRLAGRGEIVFGTTKGASNAAVLAELGLRPVVADVLDRASLVGLPTVDRVLYCVGFDRSAGLPMRTVYVEGLRHTLDALRGKTARVVFISTTSVYGRNDGGWVDENSPTEPTTESGRVCLEAEQVAAGCVIVRASGLYGPGRIVRREALERGEPIVGDPSKWLNMIHIDDAASAAIAALERGEPGRVYLASDDRPVERREFYHLAARALNAPSPRFVAPEPGTAEARREDSNKRVSNRRIRTELGLSLVYPDIANGLPAAIQATADG